MEIKHVLIDMDGVLVDWSGSVCALFGKPQQEIASWDNWHYLGISEEEMWTAVDAAGADFWRQLPKYPWFSALMTSVQGYPWTIATSPSKDPTSAIGKRLWLTEHLGRDFTNYMMGKQKWLMASPGVVLIDDSDKNVNEFRKAGGHAVLFPQPWNTNRNLLKEVDRVEYVRSEFNKLRSIPTVCTRTLY